MHIEPHPIRRRPIGAILEARRREKAALAARCRSFGAIAEALAHYRRNSVPTLTSADRRGRWELLGDYAGAAAAAEAASLQAASPLRGSTPEDEHPCGGHGAAAQAREAAAAAWLAETRG